MGWLGLFDLKRQGDSGGGGDRRCTYECIVLLSLSENRIYALLSNDGLYTLTDP